MFQAQPYQQLDIGAMLTGKLTPLIYRRLELDGKLDGVVTEAKFVDGSRNIKASFAFEDGTTLPADKVLRFNSLMDGYRAKGYPSVTDRAMQAIQDERYMGQVADRIVKKILAICSHDWTHFACLLNLIVEGRREYLVAVIAVNAPAPRPLEEAEFQWIGDSELDKWLEEVKPDIEGGHNFMEPAATAANLLPEG
jgi:hypothetical protein